MTTQTGLGSNLHSTLHSNAATTHPVAIARLVCILVDMIRTGRTGVRNSREHDLSLSFEGFFEGRRPACVHFSDLLTTRNTAGESPQPEFRHSDLRSNTSIRLIQVHSVLFRGDIWCTLQHFDTDTQAFPDYIALSYEWGGSTPTHAIYINGLVYGVHHSLWEFLNHIRSQDETERTWLWTDLICIDQAHHSEKNEQISRMGDIYAQATCVLSWLGNRQKTAEALRVFVDISEGIYTESEPEYAWRSSESERIHRACDQLAFAESYWDRVWILQEVACARHCIVACGDVSINFEDLLHKMEVAMRRSDRFVLDSDRDRRIKRLKALVELKTSIQQRKTINILKLIEKTSFSRATRDQDRIYGLIGLASRLDPGFDPNALEISQHKTLTDVWWDMIFTILDKSPDIRSMNDDLDAVAKLIGRKLPPPRTQWPLEVGSSNRRAQAETASQVSEAAYSWSIQTSLGITDWDDEDDRKEYEPRLLTSREALRASWSFATEHVYTKGRHVPGLQTSLGRAAYAGLRFSSWHDSDVWEHSLPLGWFCAAHMPDPLSKITAKRLIKYTNGPIKHLNPSKCSGAGHSWDDKARCDLSSIMLKIEQLGITCLVRSVDPELRIEFYCDCCDPRTAPRGFFVCDYRD